MERPSTLPARNARCPCGSGRRYKDCHGALAAPARNDASESADAALAARLGEALAAQSRGDLAAAEAGYRAALRQAPAHFDALHMLGVVRHQSGDHDEAVALLTRAVELHPHHAPAFSNLGLALQARGAPAQALAQYDRALALQPDFAAALNNRGMALRDLGRADDARASFDAALSLTPDAADVLSNLGNVLLELRRHDDAAHIFARLVALKPGYPWALGYLYQARMNGCDWTGIDALAGQINAAVRAGASTMTPFAYLALSESPSDQLQCARTWAVTHGARARTALARGARYGHERIRVAYLSADFRAHAMAYLTAHLFELHDRSRFDITALSFGPPSSAPMRARLERAFDTFIDVREMADGDIARLMREREIDIAVDLMGYTQASRPSILAQRPAPVQVNYLGYPGTLGAAHIDYLLADRHVVAPADESFYVEKIVRLPDTYMVTDSSQRLPDATPSRAELGLPDAGFVFCCFNNNYKITPRVFDGWMRLVAATPDSVLWLLEDNPVASRNLRAEAARRGVAPARLVFAPRTTPDAHLVRHRRADLYLDTLPYNAHTTAVDALRAGVPLVTCSGGTFAARVAGSLLHAAGMPELVTRSLSDCEALALALAHDPAQLAAVRRRLAAHLETHPLFDTPRFCDHLESAYVTMWTRNERGEPPATFDVESARPDR